MLKNLKPKAWLIENDFKNKKTLVFFHEMQAIYQIEFINLIN